MLSSEEKIMFHHLRDDIEQIAAAASHDLRDQLREALTHCKTLRENTDVAALPVVEKVEQCINDTLANVGALRQYSYLAQNLETVQPLSLEGVLQKARLNNAELLAARNGSISWSPSLPAIEGRPAQLELLFTHVFQNGLIYNSSPNPQVSVNVVNTGHFYECIIEDNGDGMEPEFAYLVFGLFKRIDPTGPIRGCGAGLSFAKKVAENHGGVMMLDSEPGCGCRVTLTLPHRVDAAQDALFVSTGRSSSGG